MRGAGVVVKVWTDAQMNATGFQAVCFFTKMARCPDHQ